MVGLYSPKFISISLVSCLHMYYSYTCTFFLKETFVPGKVRGLMDYLISEQQREMAENSEDVLLSDEMLFALIADIVLAGTLTRHLNSENS